LTPEQGSVFFSFQNPLKTGGRNLDFLTVLLEAKKKSRRRITVEEEEDIKIRVVEAEYKSGGTVCII
jgi:Fe-S cluster assembly ATPase SufC